MRPQGRRNSFNRRDALSLWHRVTLESILESGPDLSARQLALLTTIYLEDGPHTVRSLADRLGVTKAVITRAVDTLENFNFVCRAKDPLDKRSVFIKRTGPGSCFLSRFAETICAEFKTGNDLSPA